MKIYEIRKVTDRDHLNLFSIGYTDRNQAEKSWVFASRSAMQNPLKKRSALPDAVVVVPFHIDTQKLVVIKEFRLVLAGYQYGFPAGLVDQGETVETAGIRELFEETGLQVVRVLKQSPVIYSSSGMTDESISLLYVNCKGEPSCIYNEASEDIEVLLLSPDEAGFLLEHADIPFDVKSWIIINTWAAQGII
jgi:ADP-ribose pyrophosphatase